MPMFSECFPVGESGSISACHKDIRRAVMGYVFYQGSPRAARNEPDQTSICVVNSRRAEEIGTKGPVLVGVYTAASAGSKHSAWSVVYGSERRPSRRVPFSLCRFAQEMTNKDPQASGE